MVRFRSILFPGDVPPLESAEPDFFVDLHLDQVLESVTAGREQYELKPFFYAPLHEVAAVRYRHEVLRDLEKSNVLEAITRFASRMRRTRAHLAQVVKLHHPLQKQAWLLDAIEIYCGAVRSLAEDLVEHDVTSRGFKDLRDYLAEYAAADRFTSLAAETQALKGALAGVRYAVRIQARNRHAANRRCTRAHSPGAALGRGQSLAASGVITNARPGSRGTGECRHTEGNCLSPRCPFLAGAACCCGRRGGKRRENQGVSRPNAVSGSV